MKKSLNFTIIALCAFTIGLCFNNFAVSAAIANYKIAVVDVQKVVTKSAQVNALKKEQNRKIQELAKFVEKAKADIAKEKNADKRKALEDRYNKELNDKKATIDKEYSRKLHEIDKNISSVISAKAKEKNYTIVLSKGIVLFGGDDITDAVAKAVK